MRTCIENGGIEQCLDYIYNEIVLRSTGGNGPEACLGGPGTGEAGMVGGASV